MKLEKPVVEIKGFGGTLGLLLDSEALFDQVVEELKKLLQRTNSKGFFRGAEIFLKGDRHKLSTEEFERLKRILKQEGDLHLKPVAAEIAKPQPEKEVPPEVFPDAERLLSPEQSLNAEESAGSRADVEAVPLSNSEVSPFHQELLKAEQNTISESFPSPKENPAENPAKKPETDDTPEEDLFFIPNMKTSQSLLVRQTLHSGQSVRSKISVVLMGDVNAGAEIVSDQDVFVLGTIRGMVHAGAGGNRDARVFALRFQPTQIRIAELISQPSSEDKKKAQLAPEIAFIEDDVIYIETCWKLRV
ncbi:MAG: hypothetical protein HQM13_09985 [SAR324 cluster bacterium]|nr:hypothetical protein [SAR324 cluster bacterium]